MKISPLSAGITLFLLTIFLFFGATGTFSAMHANHGANGEQTQAALPCPLTVTAAMCPLAPFEHLKHFKALMLGLIPVNVLVFVVVLFAFIRNFVKEFYSALNFAFGRMWRPQRGFAYEFVRPPQLRFFTKSNQRLYE